jgi:polysaccharide biosynthesis PFTS motif protein
MDTDNEFSAIRSAKLLIRNPLSNLYPINIASLFVDRLFSKLPIDLRFINKESSGELQQEQICNAISKIESSKKDLFRDIFLVSFLLGSIFLGIVCNRSKSQSFRKSPSFIYSLTPEQILSKGSTKQLREFLREPRFQKLFHEKHLVIESKQLYKFFGQNKYRDIEIVFDTSLWIAKNELNRRIVLKVILESFSRLIQVLTKRKQYKMHILREFLIDEIVWRHFLEKVHKSKQISIVTTQTHFLRLPYAFYIDSKDRIHRSMFWYSTNSTPIQNRKTQMKFDPNHYAFENIDSHYVWTFKHKQFLSKYNPSADIVVAGSILFRPRQKIVRRNPNSIDEIVIFDVTPINGLGIEVFYSREILTDFMQDLVSILRSNTSTKLAHIMLKPKRDNRKKLRGRLTPSGDYLNFIEGLNQSEVIEILSAETDLYQLVGKSSLVVGIPFTSPVVLAKEMNITCFFYVPDSANNWEIGKRQDDIAIIKGRRELSAFIKKYEKMTKPEGINYAI